MKKILFLFLLLVSAQFCFTQTQSGYSFFRLNDLLGHLDYSAMFKPAQMALENGKETQNISIFAGAPLWVKDLRRGEIVFFGTLPFTVFFTRTIMGVFRMRAHDWDQRYAPWPFQPAGAVALDKNELIWMFSIAGAASLVISVTDHFIVRHKRKIAAMDKDL